VSNPMSFTRASGRAAADDGDSAIAAGGLRHGALLQRPLQSEACGRVEKLAMSSLTY